MSFWIKYQNNMFINSNASLVFYKYYNHGTSWQTVEALQHDNFSITVIKMYEV